MGGLADCISGRYDAVVVVTHSPTSASRRTPADSGTHDDLVLAVALVQGQMTGCYQFEPDFAIWYSPNAKYVAMRHSIATGHYS